jgi:hypothetical protein
MISQRILHGLMIAVRTLWLVSIELDWLALFGLANILLLYFPDFDFLTCWATSLIVSQHIRRVLVIAVWRRSFTCISLDLSAWCCVPELPFY